jgi:hypothetical protein
MELTTMAKKKYRVAIVFPADPAQGISTPIEKSRFARTGDALAAEGLEVVAAPFVHGRTDELRERLMQTDGVLVWINPIIEQRDRSALNAVLTDVASAGVFVSAHPEIIAKIGTKEVLYLTGHMGWGSDLRHYPTFAAMCAGLPASLASGMPRVVKQVRGHSGDGVWKVELAEPIAARSAGPAIPMAARVRVRHAQRGHVEETVSLEAFLDRSKPYFGIAGGMIDQVYQARLTDGMIRCYLVRDRVAGFGEQLINALYPPAPGAPPSAAPAPGPRLYYPPTRPDFQRLKAKLEDEWLDELCSAVGMEKARLPMIWDADFMYGAKGADGTDTYVLCEINVSSVYPFPDDALRPLAAETRAQLERRH